MWRQTAKLAKGQPRLLVAARREGTPRQQHQLMAASNSSDDQLRESRRMFILSLREVMDSFPKVPAAVKDTGVGRSFPKRKPSIKSFDSPLPKADLSTDELTMSQGRNNMNPETRCKTQNSLEASLWEAIKNQNAVVAGNLVTKALKSKFELSHRIFVQLFYLLVPSDPILAYSIAKKCRGSDALTTEEFRMYLKLCSTIGAIELSYSQRGKVNRFVTNLIDDVLAMDKKWKQELLPKIITGLAAQRSVRAGAYAKDLYLHMVNNEYEIRPGWLKQLLNLSKYNRQEDLPFDDIMERLVAADTLPHPLPVIAAVHNMFPFTDSEKMCRTLKALLHFQEHNVLKNFSMYSSVDEIRIDLDCLETISMGAAQTGSVEMILLVWDVLMQCNYEPTEAIFENTVIAFSVGGGQLHSALGAIVAMKDHGYEVPRSLLRSFSLALRSDEGMIDAAMQLLASTPELQTLETFNAVMSCYSERGDTWDVFGILDHMLLKGISPDCNSYSFAMEALGKCIHRRRQHDNPSKVQENLDHADRILCMMEENHVLPSTDFVRNYVELLCLVGETKTADALVDDMLEQIPESVCSKTLYKLAVTNAEQGDFERAKQLASRITDHIPTLMSKIRSRQQRARHVKLATNSSA